MSFCKEKMKKIINSNKITKSGYKLYLNEKKKLDFEKRKKTKDTDRIAQLKNAKQRKRCFVIGNGPSLTIADLEKIGNEDSFAVNRIYKIFNQTSWRPTYYVSQDRVIADEVKEDIESILKNCKHVFLNSVVFDKIEQKFKCDKLHFIFLNDRDRDGEMPFFSDDVVEQIYEGNTVTYACIQLAVYMGYSEIYIIGVDHSYNKVESKDGSVIEDKTVQNYMPGLEGKMGFLPALDRSTLAYRKARQICDERNIIIRNATRGGKLEEFIRVDFDSLF